MLSPKDNSIIAVADLDQCLTFFCSCHDSRYGLSLQRSFKFSFQKAPSCHRHSCGVKKKPHKISVLEPKSFLQFRWLSYLQPDVCLDSLSPSSYAFGKGLVLSHAQCSVAKSGLIVCNPVDCSPPGFSAHGFLQARMLEWVAMPPSKGSS